MSAWSMLFAAVLVSCGLTGLVRALAARAKLIDVPNERSSHARPTPRGGGIAIVASFLVGLSAMGVWGPLPAPVFAGLLAGAALVAAIGFADDRWRLRASLRLVGHIAAALWVMAFLGRLPPLTLAGHAVDLSWVGPPLTLLYLVWAVNFFNFMDGIDGIAALETMTVALGGASLNAMVLGGSSWVMPVLLAACAAGFLLWNWPPARIFMGDAGSGFLGLAIGAMTIGYGCLAPVLFWCWFILQGCFMVDATTTLIRRVLRGERPQQAHRSHAYQFAARRLDSHRVVTLAFAAVTALWLFPIALSVALGKLDGLWALLIAYIPLIALAYHFKAGAHEQQQLPNPPSHGPGEPECP
jgi:Fuc2NAc and GlcNAc transferase